VLVQVARRQLLPVSAAAAQLERCADCGVRRLDAMRQRVIAEIYLARAGINPLALYAVLQKMTALGNKSASLAQLHKTHPALDARMDRIDRRGYGALEPYTTRE
jgi:hypothetical protein